MNMESVANANDAELARATAPRNSIVTKNRNTEYPVMATKSQIELAESTLPNARHDSSLQIGHLKEASCLWPSRRRKCC